jgi:type I restriction-modification system DNA methylase subunit
VRARPPAPPSIAGIVKKFESLGHSHSTWSAYSDFLELAAIAISNQCDLRNVEEREAAYMRTAGKYKADELALFCQILADVAIVMDEEPTDVLGQVYMRLELGNKWAGQFFTPQSLAAMMGLMTLDPDGARAAIAKRGYITASDPAIGGGVTIIGFCKAMIAAGLDFKGALHVTGTDVDLKAVHMAYIQLALLGVPALIVHGNTISLQEYSHWYTPAHVFGGWTQRLARRPALPLPNEVREECHALAC